MNIAVIYGTTEGQTHKLAEYLANLIRVRGATVHVLDGEVTPREHSFAEYDAVLIGTAIHRGRHQRLIFELVEEHHRELNRIPSALFTVSLDPGRAVDEQAANQYNAQFAEQTRWIPLMEATFRGALPKNHYGFLRCLRSSAYQARRHQDSDLEHDYDYYEDMTAKGFIDAFMDLLELQSDDFPPARL